MKCVCVCVVFNNGALLKVFGEQQPRLFWGFPWDHMTNSSTGYNPVPALEASFVENRWPVRTPDPSLFGDFIKIVFIYENITFNSSKI